jgi:hypothetical protein
MVEEFDCISFFADKCYAPTARSCSIREFLGDLEAIIRRYLAEWSATLRERLHYFAVCVRVMRAIEPFCVKLSWIARYFVSVRSSVTGLLKGLIGPVFLCQA